MAEEIEGGEALNDVKYWRAQLRTFSAWLGRRVRRVEVRRHRWPLTFHLAWSLWRRRHQARAMRCHWRKRLRRHTAGWLPHAA